MWGFIIGPTLFRPSKVLLLLTMIIVWVLDEVKGFKTEERFPVDVKAVERLFSVVGPML